MKESIVAILIILIIIFVCMYTTSFTSAFCNEMKYSVTECINAAEKNDWNAAKEHIDTAKNLFDKKNFILKAFSSHKEFGDINIEMLKIDAAIKTKTQEDCISEASSLIGYLDLILDSDRLTLENIL